MKILHVISNLQTGGAQRLVALLAIGQKEAGLDVEVLVYKRENSKIENNILENGIPLLEWPESKGANRIKKITGLRKIIRNYNIIHVHLFPTLYEVALAHTGLKNTLIFTEHSTHNRRRDIKILRPIEKLVYNCYNAITAISPATAKNLTQWLGNRLTSRIHVVNNGIRLPNEVADVKNNLKTVLMVSRFAPAKDHKTVIDAIEAVTDDVKFLFAGDGELLPEIKKYARDKGVIDRCVFLGNVEDIECLIDKSSIGVQSSHWEGFGLTALEFMSRGKPIIATDLPGLKDVIGSAGLLFPPGDAETLAKHINRLFASPEEYKQYREAGIIQAKNYSIDRTVTGMIKIYKQGFND